MSYITEDMRLNEIKQMKCSEENGMKEVKLTLNVSYTLTLVSNASFFSPLYSYNARYAAFPPKFTMTHWSKVLNIWKKQILVLVLGNLQNLSAGVA